ncbi:MAG: DNA recombination protein RmuC [Verrucomicrobiota bacterium]|jgi:DNA recombination protein RmuC
MPAAVYVLIGLVIGAAFGFLWGLLVGRSRAPAPDDRLANELRQQAAQRESELARLREEMTGALRAQAEAQAQSQAAEKLVAGEKQFHENALREAREAQSQAMAELRAAFRSLSLDALRELQPQFTERIVETVGKLQESAKGDLAQRQQAIATLVEPLKQQLETYQRRLQQAESAQASTVGEVKKQLETLSQSSLTLAQETQQFRVVLKSNQARGRWGEETLRRVIEAAGMSAHCDFTEQTQAGEGKPDLLVRLPGERVIIVDAKVPDLDFLSALESADTATRAQCLGAHAAKLRATIKSLADRDYAGQLPNAFDYVVLFLPAESLFSAALEGDRDLIVWAASKRILLATPASLIGLLRVVSLTWQQHDQTEHAQEIAEAAQELYARVAKFGEHLDKLRGGLERANTAFNEAAASFQSRVRPAGERFVKLGGGAAGKDIPELRPLDAPLRLPSDQGNGP